MAFIAGQVFNMGKFLEQIKNAKEKRELSRKRLEDISYFNASKEEIELLKSSIDQMAEHDAIESSIYRLKAAELDFNRQLRSAKSEHN